VATEDGDASVGLDEDQAIHPGGLDATVGARAIGLHLNRRSLHQAVDAEVDGLVLAGALRRALDGHAADLVGIAARHVPGVDARDDRGGVGAVGLCSEDHIDTPSPGQRLRELEPALQRLIRPLEAQGLAVRCRRVIHDLRRSAGRQHLKALLLDLLPLARSQTFALWGLRATPGREEGAELAHVLGEVRPLAVAAALKLVCPDARHLGIGVLRPEEGQTLVPCGARKLPVALDPHHVDGELRPAHAAQ